MKNSDRYFCAKCGEDNTDCIKIVWIDAIDIKDRLLGNGIVIEKGHVVPERLQCTCGRCGYEWSLPPLNIGNIKDLAQKLEEDNNGSH